MVKILRVDGTEEDLLPESGNKRLTLTQLQKAVGGYIELIKSYREGIMFADEDGNMKGRQMNVMASSLAGQKIVGDVVIGSVEELS
jgi:hypothetical protein